MEQRRKRSLQEVLVSAIVFLKRSQQGPEGNVLVDAAMRSGLLSSHKLFCVELRMPESWDRAPHFPVVAAGKGAQTFFRASPWVDLRGRMFSMLVHPKDRPTLESVARLITSGGGRERANEHGCCGRARLRLVHFYTASVLRQTSGQAQDCGEALVACEYISLDLQLTAHQMMAQEAAQGQVDVEGEGVLLLLADLHAAKPQLAPAVREMDEGEYQKSVRDTSHIRASHSDLWEGALATSSNRHTESIRTAPASSSASESAAVDEPLPGPGAMPSSRLGSIPDVQVLQSGTAQNSEEPSTELNACEPLREFYDWLDKSDEAGKKQVNSRLKR